jgi:uncharacterized protein YfiM (DUF2279 family)
METKTSQVPYPFTVVGGFDGTYPRPLLVDSSGQVLISVPGGLATAANQVTEINYLQFIAALRNALASVGLDKLLTSVVDSALPAGAATSANQSTEISNLQLIAALRNALASVGTDKLRTSVIDSALPTGAATAANQSTEITSLQLIDDLRNALDSVGTDTLRVRAGYDGTTWRTLKTDTNANLILASQDSLGNLQGQYYSRYEETGSDTNAPSGNVTKNLTAVATGYIMELENVWAFNNTRAARVQLNRVQNGHTHRIVDITQSAAGVTVYWNGRITMAAGDYVSILFAGTVAGDALYWGASGRTIRIA